MQQTLPVHWPEGLSVYPVLLLAVVGIAWLLPLPTAYHPLTLFRFFTRQLAQKVNPDPHRTVEQLYISGSLALMLCWLMPMLMAFSLYRFSDLPWLLDALLLYISLDWRHQQQTFLRLTKLLQQGQLSLARDLSRQLLCRKTANLSAMGLSKALLETMVLRSARDYIGVLGAFLLGGGIAAIGYRLLLEIQQQWNTKRSSYRHFGRPAALFAAVFTSMPKLFSALLLALQVGFSNCVKQCRKPRLNISRLSYWLICCASVAVKRNLGGPLYYNNDKIPRSKIQQQTEPEPADITRLHKRLQFSHTYAMLIIIASICMQWLWHAIN